MFYWKTLKYGVCTTTFMACLCSSEWVTKWLSQDNQAAHKPRTKLGSLTVAIEDQLSFLGIVMPFLQAADGHLFSLLVTIWINLGPLTNSDLAKKTDLYKVIQSFTFSVLHESWQVKKHLRIRQFLLLQ